MPGSLCLSHRIVVHESRVFCLRAIWLHCIASLRRCRSDCSQLCLRSFYFDHFGFRLQTRPHFMQHIIIILIINEPIRHMICFPSVFKCLSTRTAVRPYLANDACVCNSFQEEHEICFVRLLLLFDAIAFLSTRSQHQIERRRKKKKTEHKFCRMREIIAQVFRSKATFLINCGFLHDK